MQYRKLGRTSFPVSDIGYGAWGIGGKQWLGGNDDESLKALRRAIDLGVNLIDTALAYGDGHSEILVGQVVRQTSRKIYVATKVPPKNRIWPAQNGSPYQRGVSVRLHHALRRREPRESEAGYDRPSATSRLELRMDRSRRLAPRLQRSQALRQDPGGRHLAHRARSRFRPWRCRSGEIDAVQVIYNIFDQLPANNLLPLCQEQNVGVLARVPLDEGSLTDTFGVKTTFPPGDFRDWYFRGRPQAAGR